MLAPEDFAAFFREVHGLEPFPWQVRLLRRIAETGKWPSVLDLPTGSGKTAAIDIAVFHLALEAERGEARRAPVRIAFVVDRRLVVDDAFARAKKLAEKLEQASSDPSVPVTAGVAEQLRKFSKDGPPLIARRLRGGIPREDDWARTPAQPTVLCSTVDQVGSRLLFRGYGVSDAMKPVHAGLIGSDCLILLDEAHLAEPFQQTLKWIGTYRGARWLRDDSLAPWGVALLSATPGKTAADTFPLDDADRSDPTLKRRLAAAKPARLVGPAKAEAAPEAGDEEADRHDHSLTRRVAAIVEEIRKARAHFESGKGKVSFPAIGVVVNRVARARAVFERVRKELATDDEVETILMIGPCRPADRDGLAERLDPVRTGAKRDIKTPLIIVATQCLEAGVDIDLDALVTEAAPLDSLRQRFGRLNRTGRDIVPYAAIVAAKSDISARNDDPVYGKSIKEAWDRLLAAAEKRGGDPFVEFGIDGCVLPFGDAAALSPKPDAPVLLPAHLDLLRQTSPIPAADPDVALYLHGAGRQPDSITVVWRADIDPERGDDVRRLLLLVPPRVREAIVLPIWAVRQWLRGDGEASADRLADAVALEPEEERRRPAGGRKRKVFCWKGDDDRSRWIDPGALRPGDAIVVPAAYGGVDEFGWNPGFALPAKDLGQAAASPFAGRRFAVRVAPELVGGADIDDALADALAGAVSRHWRDMRAAVLDLALPQSLRDDLLALDHARPGQTVAAYPDLYGSDGDGRPRGVVFLAPRGIKAGIKAGIEAQETDLPGATEDDIAGSLGGFGLPLRRHAKDVRNKARDFAEAAGLPPGRVRDIAIAAFLHDDGKRDSRFQGWLYHDDPLGPDPDKAPTILAKSGRLLSRAAREKSGLPKHWRHEALSVRLARAHRALACAADKDLVLWLIGSHHGHGRPFFPHHHHDPEEQARDIGPQSLAFDWRGLDWPSLFAHLSDRYGPWELARMEAILRLADHRASEASAAEKDGR